jgi:hypothetical protein
MERKLLKGAVVVVKPQADLLEVVAATHPTGGFPGRLNGRQ